MPQWSRLVSLSGWVALWQGVISGPHGRKHMRKLSFATTLCCSLSASASSVPRLKRNNGPIMATAASAQLWTWLQVANFMAQCFTCSTTPWPIPSTPFCVSASNSTSVRKFLTFWFMFFLAPFVTASLSRWRPRPQNIIDSNRHLAWHNICLKRGKEGEEGGRGGEKCASA